MKHLPKSVWRSVHLTSYVTFLLGSLHGTFAGTDATNRLYVSTSILTTVVLTAALSYRIATRGARPRRHRTQQPAHANRAAPVRRRVAEIPSGDSSHDSGNRMAPRDVQRT